MRECANCFFSRPVGSDLGVACHRYPPTITEAKGPTVTSYFPLVNNNSWCGEWRRQVNGKTDAKRASSPRRA